jgi:hypothetical protein
MILRLGYLTSSVSTRLSKHGGPALCLSGTLESGLHTTVQRTLQIQLTVGTSGALERGRGIGWLWIRYPVERDVGERCHFLMTQSSKSVASAVDLATIPALVIGKLVRYEL